MWRDLFELNIALREASRVYHDPAILSAIEKIEGATSTYVQVEMTTNETMLADVSAAVEDHQQIKILYTAATADEARSRSIEPREIKVLMAIPTCGPTARPVNRGELSALTESTRSSRPPTRPKSARATPSSTGSPRSAKRVTRSSCHRIVASVALRATAQRAVVDPGRRATRRQVPVSNELFLDQLMLRAGEGAVVATPKFAKAGHELAKRIAASL